MKKIFHLPDLWIINKLALIAILDKNNAVTMNMNGDACSFWTGGRCERVRGPQVFRHENVRLLYAHNEKVFT